MGADRADQLRQTAPRREQRRSVRHKVLWSARLACAFDERQCTILNISRHGAQVKLDAALNPGFTVALRIPGIGTFSASVVWSRDNRAGLRFDELPADLAAALDQALRGHRRGPLQPVP